MIKFSRVAVIGASNNPSKYGYKITQDLLQKGYTVYPVNPRESLILDQPVYPDIPSLPPETDLVVFVTPPSITRTLLPQLADRPTIQLWIQPGAADQAVHDYLQTHQLSAITDACLMLSHG